MENEAVKKPQTGRIIRISSAVVDVRFEKGALPRIRELLYTLNTKKPHRMEVVQHTGDRIVRCIMLDPSEGLSRDTEVVSAGGSIAVPVGEEVLGRLFNALGDTIDGKDHLPESVKKLGIYRPAPSYA